MKLTRLCNYFILILFILILFILILFILIYKIQKKVHSFQFQFATRFGCDYNRNDRA